MADPSQPHPSAWEKTKATSKNIFEKVGSPFNKLSNKLGAEAFWPTSLDKECDKAARILRSFCKDGFYAELDNREGDLKEREQHGVDPAKRVEGPKGKKKALQKIPAEVIQNARGLAIFTVMRAGLHWSGAGGSGVVIERLPNGQWSPPSGILIHTLGFGLMVGADIYDCVIVINNEKGMEGFKRVRCTLGGEISATAGPVGAGATLDSEIHKRQAPLWTYMKSRGFYVGAQVDGTIVLERSEENAKFYGRKGVRCHEILAGQVSAPMGSTGMLHETLKLAEGRQYDEGLLNKSGVMDGMSPGDAEVEEPTKEELRRREGMGL